MGVSKEAAKMWGYLLNKYGEYGLRGHTPRFYKEKDDTLLEMYNDPIILAKNSYKKKRK